MTRTTSTEREGAPVGGLAEAEWLNAEIVSPARLVSHDVTEGLLRLLASQESIERAVLSVNEAPEVRHRVAVRRRCPPLALP